MIILNFGTWCSRNDNIIWGTAVVSFYGVRKGVWSDEDDSCLSSDSQEYCVCKNGCCHVFGDYTGYVIDSRAFSSGLHRFICRLVLVVVGMFILSVTCSGIGMLVASFSKTLDNFAAIMNFVIFPVFFLSGSLYPITNLPYALKVLAQANPYTYGVDILKHGILVPNGGTSDIPLIISFLVLIGSL